MTLNAFIDDQRRNRYRGNKSKQDETNKCELIIKSHMNNGLVLQQNDLPVNIQFVWYRTNRRSDKDNIAFAKKFILDGMVNSGLISNDGWDQIGDFSDSFRIDRENPRAEVILKRAE